MNCITLHQPYATAIAIGLKTIETRSWPAPECCIGMPLAIAAGKKDTGELRAWWMEHVKRRPVFAEAFARAGYENWDQLPFGAVVCTTKLHLCVSTNGHPPTVDERARIQGRYDGEWGNFAPDRFAWFLTDRKPLPTPVPVIGRQGIYPWRQE